MIWADRVGLVWAFIFAGLFPTLIVRPADYGLIATSDIEIAAAIVVVPWLLLRGLDFIFTGAIRFRGT